MTWEDAVLVLEGVVVFVLEFDVVLVLEVVAVVVVPFPVDVFWPVVEVDFGLSRMIRRIIAAIAANIPPASFAIFPQFLGKAFFEVTFPEYPSI